MKKTYNYPKINAIFFNKETVITISTQLGQSEYDRVIKSLKDLGIDNNPRKVKW